MMKPTQTYLIWGTGYRRFDIKIIENDKIAIRLTDIFHPEPIEYYLK